MKQKFLSKILLVALALVGGASEAWGDPVYQNLPLKSSSAYLDMSKYDGALPTGLAVNSTDNKKIDFNQQTASKPSEIVYYVTVATASYYTMEMDMSWFRNANDKVKITIEDVSSSIKEAEQEFGVNTTGNSNIFPIAAGSLSTGNKKLTIAITGNSNRNDAYIANIAFSTLNVQAWPTVSAGTYFDLSKAICTTARYESGNQNIGSVKKGATVELYANNTSEALYNLHMGVTYYGTGTFTFTITDMLSGTVEVNQTFDVPNINSYADQTFPVLNSVTTGVKQIKFTFEGTGNGSGYILNFKNVRFGTYDSWPMAGGTTEYLSLQNHVLLGPSSIRVEGDGTTGVGNGWRLGYVNAETYAEYYATNASTNYYSIKMKFYSASVDSQVKLTITDVASTTTEVEQTFTVTTAGGDQEFIITNKVTSGLKKIRFDFLSSFNQLQLVQFAVNSKIMDEAVDYTPVAAAGANVTLKRSITAGNWSTIVLPFAMTEAQLKTAFGDDVKLGQLTAATSDQLTFSTATELNANEPYLIKVSSDVSGEKSIENVTIVSATPSKTVSPVTFAGTYSKINLPAGAFFLSSNNLYKNVTESSKRTIKPFRAYFTVATSAPSLQFVFDGETTGIAHFDADGSINVEEGVYYNLRGQRVSQPTKGLYIVNGKKVVIK